MIKDEIKKILDEHRTIENVELHKYLENLIGCYLFEYTYHDTSKPSALIKLIEFDKIKNWFKAIYIGLKTNEYLYITIIEDLYINSPNGNDYVIVTNEQLKELKVWDYLELLKDELDLKNIRGPK